MPVVCTKEDVLTNSSRFPRSLSLNGISSGRKFCLRASCSWPRHCRCYICISRALHCTACIAEQTEREGERKREREREGGGESGKERENRKKESEEEEKGDEAGEEERKKEKEIGEVEEEKMLRKISKRPDLIRVCGTHARYFTVVSKHQSRLYEPYCTYLTSPKSRLVAPL